MNTLDKYPTPESEPEYITPTALCKERNWSRSKIEPLLGEPDETFVIPRSGGMIGSLYLLSRVEAVEREHKPFKCERRKQSALSVAERKRAEIRSWIQDLDIKFSVPPDTTLQSLAKAAIDNRNLNIPEWKWDKTAVSVYKDGCEADEHVHRWMVNYLRHVCTDYHAQLDARFGTVGVQEAYYLLREKINLAAESLIGRLSAKLKR
jgi:hypothetical protein